MKALFKIIFKRLHSKNPKFFTYLAAFAGVIAVLFFGADKVIDLSPWVSESILHMLYVACITIAGVSQLPVSDMSKHHQSILEKPTIEEDEKGILKEAKREKRKERRKKHSKQWSKETQPGLA